VHVDTFDLNGQPDAATQPCSDEAPRSRPWQNPVDKI
jgi:hypothetical protein